MPFKRMSSMAAFTTIQLNGFSNNCMRVLQKLMEAAREARGIIVNMPPETLTSYT